MRMICQDVFRNLKHEEGSYKTKAKLDFGSKKAMLFTPDTPAAQDILIRAIGGNGSPLAA